MSKREAAVTSLAFVVLVLALLVGSTIQGDATVRAIPSSELTADDCRRAGLFPIHLDELPGPNWYTNGLICVEHVEPVGN